jgi:hypothetical protein
MRRSILIAAALALLTTTAAQAGRTNLVNSGLWATDIYNTNGKQMCVMTVTKVWQNGAVGLLQFKFDNGHYFTHLTKSNWRIASGTEIPMTLAFDTGTRPGTGTVIEDQTGGSTIETGISDDAAEGVLADFANAKTLSISFDSGNEAPWVVTMTGSRKALAVFNQCVNYVKVNGPTQPGAQSKTQPGPAQPANRRKDDGGI